MLDNRLLCLSDLAPSRDEIVPCLEMGYSEDESEEVEVRVAGCIMAREDVGSDGQKIGDSWRRAYRTLYLQPKVG